MEEGRYEENHSTCRYLAVSLFSDRYVDVTHCPHVHGHVPRTPEHGDIIGVPPVAIKPSISEVKQLSHQIQERVESQIEKAEPY
jgi:hypothetical protein